MSHMNSTRMRKLAALDWGSPWLFFFQVYASTWIFLIPIALEGRTLLGNPLVLAVVGISMMADEIFAVLNAYQMQKMAGLRDFFGRAIDPRRISLGWYAVIFLSQPVLMGLALLTHLALGGTMPSMETPARFLANPLSLLPFAGFILIYGPLIEELGWRGYVLDRLQLRYNAVVSSLILGFFWGVWHLPLFFIQDTHQFEKMGSMVLFIVGTILYSVLMTWIYNNNNRSTLSAILVHFMINFTGEFFNFPAAVKNYTLVWVALWALVIIAVWRPSRLARLPVSAP